MSLKWATIATKLVFKSQNCAMFLGKLFLYLPNMKKQIAIREVWKDVNLIDLVKSFPTSIWLRKSASTQPIAVFHPSIHPRVSPAGFGSQISQSTSANHMPCFLPIFHEFCSVATGTAITWLERNIDTSELFNGRDLGQCISRILCGARWRHELMCVLTPS